jgi:hypothetical protein
VVLSSRTPADAGAKPPNLANSPWVDDAMMCGRSGRTRSSVDVIVYQRARRYVGTAARHCRGEGGVCYHAKGLKFSQLAGGAVIAPVESAAARCRPGERLIGHPPKGG